jgi:predicted nucleotidyltransferase
MSDTQTKVRLSAKEMEIIRATAIRLFGDQTRIFVFGSRARENEKGGDIDLLIEIEKILPDRVASVCRLTSELQLQLGDQKIDVIIVDPSTREQAIHQIARRTGVLL